MAISNLFFPNIFCCIRYRLPGLNLGVNDPGYVAKGNMFRRYFSHNDRNDLIEPINSATGGMVFESGWVRSSIMFLPHSLDIRTFDIVFLAWATMNGASWEI